jgi:hypothetical protein
MNIVIDKQKCSVNVTTGRNRVKIYSSTDGEVVHLKDGQKFEIELFNPHYFKVMAKVKMNGHYISDSGLVLNPGQRVFLERYLDSNNSFIFSTYEIDGTVEALKAISENGNLEVEFYAENIPHGSTLTNFGGSTGYQYYHNTLIGGSSTTTLINDSTTFTCSTANLNVSYESPKGSLETGRVEKGKSTKQKFGTSNDSFNSWVSETVKVKLLPVSAKPVEVSELRAYCTECGTRVKKATWKFCPSCGNKF